MDMLKNEEKNNLKLCFIGGNQAAIIGDLTALASGARVIAAVSYSYNLTTVLKLFKIPLYESVTSEGFFKKLKQSDILLSVHGREIVKPDLLELPKLGAINVHPYLYKYKGADPVRRALRDKEYKASVGVHRMEERVDEGKVLVEEFVDITGARSVEEAYNMLYPSYATAILKALSDISQNAEEHEKKIRTRP